MRKEVVLAVADAIENAELAAKDIGFNMSGYLCAVNQGDNLIFEDHSGHNCGTVACIAGWVVILYDEDGNRRETFDPKLADEYNVEHRAMRAMGIAPPENQTELTYKEDPWSLFYPNVSWEKVTVDQACTTLRHFAETGKVIW